MSGIIAPDAQAQLRAMPLTRLIDGGMDYADASRLHTAVIAGESWAETAGQLATECRRRAEAALIAGNRQTALDEFTRSTGCYVFAQMAFNFDVPEKRRLYQELVATARALSTMPEAHLERVDLDFGGSRMAGWLRRPARQPTLGTVIMFGGQSGWGMAYRPAADAFARRGIATLMAEGPGQGETRIEQGVMVDVEIASAYSRFVDHVTQDGRLGLVGIYGNSVGGLWAAKTAAADHRIVACCVNSSFAAPRVLPFRMFAEQAAAMLGTEDKGAIERNFRRMRLRPAEDRIRCPLLVIHGGKDALLSLDDQRPFLDAASAERTLKIWEDGEHTVYNRGTERSGYVADWFASHFPDRSAC